MKDLASTDQRRRAVAWATALARGTPLEAPAHEQALLERYAQGELGLTQVLSLLDERERVHHVLYRSQAVRPFSPAQLTALLEESRAWNAEHGITGLLCHSAGRFVQLIEGEQAPVERLFTSIQRDRRHQRVTTLSTGAGPERLFPDWRMAWSSLEQGTFQTLLSALRPEAGDVALAPQLIHDPHLLTLLAAFSLV